MTKYPKKTTFGNVPVLALFWWAKMLYWRIDASKYKNRLAINLCTGVVEKFDLTDRVESESGSLVLTKPMHRFKARDREDHATRVFKAK